MPLFVRYFHVNTGTGLGSSVVGLTPVNVRFHEIADVSFDIWMLSLVMTSFISSTAEAVNSHFPRDASLSSAAAKSAVDPKMQTAIVVFQTDQNKNESGRKSLTSRRPAHRIHLANISSA